jgi:hypothetical protein
VGTEAPFAKLDMSEAARIQRAAEQGYDTSTLYHRGDAKSLTEFPPGSFWSRDVDYAAGRGSKVSGDSYQAYLKVERPFLFWQGPYGR